MPSHSTVDSVLAKAVDTARAAAEEDAPGLVGDHLGVVADDERVATHLFGTRGGSLAAAARIGLRIAR